MKSANSLDNVDKSLLRHLQTHGRATNAELAEAARLSDSACFRRVRALETERVITGYAATVDPRAVGLALTVYVSITLDSQAQDVLDGDLDRFMAAALSQRVTGEQVEVEDVD